MDPPTGTDVVTKSSVDDAVTIVDDDVKLAVTCTRYRLADCSVLAAMNAFESDGESWKTVAAISIVLQRVSLLPPLVALAVPSTTDHVSVMKAVDGATC